jgi:hypothetical protein
MKARSGGTKAGMGQNAHEHPLAKQTGHNAVQETAHVHFKSYPNGNQGFSEKNLGSDTVPGPMKGAPLTTRKPQEHTKTMVSRDGLNHFNNYEANGEGVLGAKVVDQDGGRTTDSPVPEHAEHPHLDIVTKAAEVASYRGGSVGGHAGPQANSDQTLGETWPKDGVMYRD